jgi:hypothetical protein
MTAAAGGQQGEPAAPVAVGGGHAASRYRSGGGGGQYVAAVALDRDALEAFALRLVSTSSPSRAEGAIAELVRRSSSGLATRSRSMRSGT